MRIKIKKIHKVIIKRMSDATLLVVVAQFVRPPPIRGPEKSSRFDDPYWPDEANRGFSLARIVIMKKTIKKKEENNDNK